MDLCKKDREVLRELGKAYMEQASLPTQYSRMEAWKSLNRRDAGARPMVIIDQLPWNELNGAGELTVQVEDPFFRGIELNLRRMLYKWRHFAVDMVLEPFITVPKTVHNSGYGLESQVEYLGASDLTAKSQHFTDVLTTPDDVQKIKDMVLTVDEALDREHMEIAHAVWDGVAPVRFGHGIGFHLGVWDRLSEYMGVENIYCDLYDRPEFLHACMRRITDATIAGIQQANLLQVHDDLANTCHCSYIYTDELLPQFGAGRGSTAKNCWAMGLAQLFSYVSPKVTEEFELPYIQEMAGYFDSIYYGCCDRLDDRMELVFRIPNVRKISCSPWSHKQEFAAALQGRPYIMSNKPNPAFLSGPFDEEVVRADLRQTVELCKTYGVKLEFILKDISTVNFAPEKLTRWAQIALEECSR